VGVSVVVLFGREVVADFGLVDGVCWRSSLGSMNI